MKLIWLLSIILILMSDMTMAKKLNITDGDCVVLLHGLARTAGAMKTLESRLLDEGYSVVNIGYPSRDHNIEYLAGNELPKSLSLCGKANKIHFVTHSMGGIILRQYLSQHELPELGRVVMLGPPNQGSEVVDKLANAPGFKWLNGPAGLQLGTSEESIPNKLGAVNFDLGVIAGNWSINWGLSMLIPGEDDGKVSVERSKIEGMNHHLVMPVTHPFMMKNKKVINQVVNYLREGSFK